MSPVSHLVSNNSEQVHSFVTEIEDRVPYTVYHKYAADRPFLPVIGIVFYLMTLVLGQKVMEHRQPFNLKAVLFVWNASLALFSILSTIRYTEVMLYQYSQPDSSFYSFFCKSAGDNVSAFWYMLFVYSKFVEFGDTIFLILRKRKILFLHWYHHVTVLLMAWIVFVEASAVGPFFGGVNVFIHSLMYTYYTLQTIGIRLPKAISMTLTMMQTTQMLVGLLVVYMTNYYASRGCRSSNVVTVCASIMYASYFLLFARFFLLSYVKPSPRPSDLRGEKKNQLTKDVNNNIKNSRKIE